MPFCARSIQPSPDSVTWYTRLLRSGEGNEPCKALVLLLRRRNRVDDIVRRDERQGECLLLEWAARSTGSGLFESRVIEGRPFLVERPLEGFAAARHPVRGRALGGRVMFVRVLRLRRRAEQRQSDGDSNAAQLSRPQP